MKHIQKQSEPPSFTEWKAKANEDWQPSWTDFRRKTGKHDVLQALLQEQGNLCCYCGMRIIAEEPVGQESHDWDTCHIEHLKPQSHYPELALDYDNMLASCQSESSKQPRPPSRCGSKKDDWYDPNLFISPLDPTCEQAFRYTADGQILANDTQDSTAANETISKLGLNYR